MPRKGRRVSDDPDRHRSTITTSEAGLTALVGISKARLLGETTFRNPSSTIPLRIASLVFYPLAAIGALVQPIIWIILATAFSPAARLTPYLSFLIEWVIFLSLLYSLVPSTAVQVLPEFLVTYHGLVRGIVNWMLNMV